MDVPTDPSIAAAASFMNDTVSRKQSLEDNHNQANHHLNAKRVFESPSAENIMVNRTQSAPQPPPDEIKNNHHCIYCKSDI
jgi:hypothetical protein